MHRNTRGLSLVEVLIAVALVAGLGISLMTLVSSGAQVGARASESQMASMVGARVMDRMVAIGYQGLDRKRRGSGETGVLDLSALDPKRGPWDRGRRRRRGERDPNEDDKLDPETRESRTLTVDGYVYSGRYQLSPAAPGLLRVRIRLAWDRYGVNVPKSPGAMELVRFVADPMIALAPANAPAGS